METVTIALIADIHANRYALQAFLEYLSDNPGISQVWNLGDFLQIGPHPAEIVDMLFTNSRFVTILGNNELALFQRDDTAFPADELAHQKWAMSILSVAGTRTFQPMKRGARRGF